MRMGMTIAGMVLVVGSALAQWGGAPGGNQGGWIEEPGQATQSVTRLSVDFEDTASVEWVPVSTNNGVVTWRAAVPTNVFATSTQGSKADSAVQTVTPSTGINVTTSGTERVVGVTAAIAAGAAAGTTADQPGHTQPWASITNKPTTFPPVIGSGAGDAVAGNDARLTDARAPTAHTQPASTITNLLSVAQPLDADLTRLAGNDGSALVYPTNIYTVAADYTGTNTYYIIPGTINHIRMLATGSATLKIWMPGVAGSWRAYSRLEIYNPNLKPLIWASATGSVYWPSNGVYTGTARSVGKFGVASIYTGSTSHEVILVATNATELFYP